MKYVKQDLTQLARKVQLCRGRKCDIEDNIHSLSSAYENQKTEGIHLMKAKKTIYSFIRPLVQKTIQKKTPVTKLFPDEITPETIKPIEPSN